MMQRLTGMLDFQAQALTLRSERQRLIASNIANADTPGYVARDFNFAQALSEASRDAGASGRWKLGTPEGDGAAAGQGAEGAPRDPRLSYAAPSQTNLDRNTVDMDRERASFVDNSLKYESTLRFINGSVKSVLDAMKNYNQG
jgi:flagellar basal-body rod protein FlgB